MTSPARAASDAAFDSYYVQNATRRLWRLGPDKVPYDTGMNVAAGSSPASVRYYTGSTVVFKRDTDGALWAWNTTAGPKLLGNGLGMAVGTNPAVALDGGTVVTAFQAYGTGNLWYVSSNQTTGHDTGIKMATGSSPSIVTTPNGIQIVYTGSDNTLYRLKPGSTPTTVANGLGVASGTSPAVAAAPDGGGNVEIAFQAYGTGNLWYVDENNIGHDTGIKMAPGTSPSVAAKSGGSRYVIVYKRNSDGMLWRMDPGYDSRYVAAGLGVAANTSPVVTGLTDGRFGIAFNAAATNDLWTVDADNVGRDTGVTMLPGTSPAVNNNCATCVLTP
ncbi:hypothetical protein [Actinoplanes couchii]|uniref:Bulb-type lectin domain-containing protein n=1 Tax=Actinoplanes couchii TaxID=403638 RepID=A0ABQ3XP67_9ACTN|nr:hypothetical protein [Actinoplanes couchii]MDR6318671.1 hypothetical protein [Actinoplanes couchii]GID60278.1 hypothetical protein Aco03nite_086820 [Actinoplanes couchii]